MKSTFCSLLFAVSLSAQIAPIPSTCVTTTNNIPMLFEYTAPMYLGQPFTVEVFTDPQTPYVVMIGLPQTQPLLDLGTFFNYPPWGTGNCFLIAIDLYMGFGTTATDGRDMFTYLVPSDPLLQNTDIWTQAFVVCNGCPYGLAPTNGLASTVQ